MDIRRRFLSKKSSGGSSGGDSSGTYTVNLNGQWEKTTAVTNPDSSLYDGVYRSSSNYNVDSGVATMYITLTGYSTFKLYIRSYAESSYDYVMVSQLDKTITGSSSYSDTTLVKAHTRGNQQSGTALSSYTLVEYTGISSGSHTITIVYRKDGSTHRYDDRGYVLIPKSSESGGDSGGGDVDIDTTYSIMYTSSDGNVVTPYSATAFGANITSNAYVEGQGIITFDGPVTKIGSYAFYNCNSLTNVTIPDSVTEIGDAAFYKCNMLKSVNIPDNVTAIGDRAFSDCTSLTSVTIGNSVTSIGNYAFYGCSSLTAFYGKFASADNRCLVIDGVLNSFARVGLTEYTIPDGVTSIGSNAFYSCSSLTSITIPDSVTSIGDAAFFNTPIRTLYYSGTLYEWCMMNISLNTSFTSHFDLYINGILQTDITIPSNIAQIKKYAFLGCNSLTSVTIPNDVTSIGSSAFSGCINLASVTIGNSVTSIGSSAFSYCSSLTSVTIPDSVTSIGDYAFSYCSSLKEVYCKPTTPPVGGSKMFINYGSSRIIYVPTASVDAYKSATGWSDYADYIQPYDFEDEVFTAVLTPNETNEEHVRVYEYMDANSTFDGWRYIWEAKDTDNITITGEFDGVVLNAARVTSALKNNSLMDLTWDGQNTSFHYGVLSSDGELFMSDDE